MPCHATKTSFKKNDPRLFTDKMIKIRKQNAEENKIRFRKRISINCDYCNENIDMIPSRVKSMKHHFCNIECYNRWQKETDWFDNRVYNLSEKGRQILSESKKGKNNPAYKRFMEMSKEKQREYMYNQFWSKWKKRPTKPEKILINIILNNGLPFRYVGDGKFWIENINPDFIHNDEKLLIEVFGNYWHNKIEIRCKDKEKHKILNKLGWKRLIFWEKELGNSKIKDIVNKIKTFNKELPCPL